MSPPPPPRGPRVRGLGREGWCAGGECHRSESSGAYVAELPCVKSQRGGRLHMALRTNDDGIPPLTPKLLESVYEPWVSYVAELPCGGRLHMASVVVCGSLGSARFKTKPFHLPGRRSCRPKILLQVSWSRQLQNLMKIKCSSVVVPSNLFVNLLPVSAFKILAFC